MLSNKMTFSLMSLITIFALVFATSAMAGEFGVSLLGVEDDSETAPKPLTPDVSHDDGLQVDRAEARSGAGNIVVRVKFDKEIEPVEAAKLSVSGYDKDGNFLPGAAPVDSDGTADGLQLTISPSIAAKEFGITIAIPETTTKLTLKIAKGIGSADPFNDDTSKELKTDIHLLDIDSDDAVDVLKIAMLGEPFATVTTATFQTHILLSEEPKGGLVADLIDAGDSTVDSIVKLSSPLDSMTIGMAGLVSRDGETLTATDAVNTLASWRDGKAHLYLVTFKTKPGEKTVKIKIKNFLSKETPTGAQLQETYVQATPESALTEGRDLLTVKTKTDDGSVPLTGGSGMWIPHGEAAMIPAGGFLVLTKDKDGSGIAYSHEKDNENKPLKQTPAQLLFNTRALGLPNLERHFVNGGSIYLTTSEADVVAGSVVISEVNWGSDESNDDSTKSQWIEIHNTTDTAIAVAEKKWALFFFNANDSLPGADAAFLIGVDDAGSAIDSMGTRDVSTGIFWSIANKGQSGRTEGLIKRTAGTGATQDVSIDVGPVVPIISMQRATAADGTYADGNMASSWSASVLPAINYKTGIEGALIGTPGGSPISLPTPDPVDPPAAEVSVAMAADITITEIMVDTDSGRLPQWIELTSSATGEVSLDGWELRIDNAIDADVLGGGNIITVDLSGVVLDVSAHTGNMGKGQSALVVAWAARDVSSNISMDRVVNVGTQLNQTRQYQLLSYKGFKITLSPPQMGGVFEPGDQAGNLHEDWEIPMSEGSRSSLIRREMNATGATLGTDANGWTLASSTSLITGQISFYGSDEDASTPGQDAGGPLPVELSHFRPARDKATGAVVITWSTQSELNNAGFFIKRSQQRDGQFKVINATMVPGAGTTSEKQFYTFTDTTAQPNVVYYYQIEDISLDGNRQTLTNGIRLKGHIGAAGKLTTSWGELKSIQ